MNTMKKILKLFFRFHQPLYVNFSYLTLDILLNIIKFNYKNEQSS